MATWTFTWYDADDNATALTAANGYQIEKGGQGLTSPPTVLNLQANTGRDGSTLVKRRRTHRPVVLPLYVNTGGSARDAVGALSSAFEGPGRLRMTDGTRTRELRQVYYEAGLEGDDSAAVSQPDEWRKVVVSLIAADPYWYDTTGSTDTVTATTNTGFDAAGTTFDAAATPFNGGALTTLTVAGDAPAFPVWTITGAFSTLTIGLAGGDAFQMSSALASSAVLTVDADPRSATYGPRLGSNPVNWGLLTGASRLFELTPGSPVIYAGGSGTDGNSDVDVAWESRYLVP